MTSLFDLLGSQTVPSPSAPLMELPASPSIRIVVDGEPVAKGRPRLGKMANGQPVAFTPAHTRKYENYVRIAASSVMGEKPPLDCQLSVEVEVCLPVPASWSNKKRHACLRGDINPISRPDLDNFIKAALDALNGIVFRDDCLITNLTARKRYSQKPRLEIEVRPV